MNKLNVALLSLSLSLSTACAGSTASTKASAAAWPLQCAEAEGKGPERLTAVLAGPQRSPENRARDQYRHPEATLAFMGLKPTSRVVELWPGAGWYTEVLAPYLAPCGALTVTGGKNLRARVAEDPGLFEKVTVVDVDPEHNPLVLGPPGSADLVLTFRNIHNWVNAGFEAKVYAAAFEVLAPGGVFGVVEHRAAPGAAEDNGNKGYMDQEKVIARIEAAGFKLEEKSEINANPKDTKDYPEGVWTLPPALALGDKDKAKYLEIGESDRMTLRFRKP
ncbi:MAG: methyltransferase [Myxococcota bacterium]